MIDTDNLRRIGEAMRVVAVDHAPADAVNAAANEIDRLRAGLVTMEEKWAAAVAAGCVIESERDAAQARLAVSSDAHAALIRNYKDVMDERNAAIVQRDAAQAKLAEVRELLGGDGIDDPSHDELCDIMHRAWLAAGGKEQS